MISYQEATLQAISIHEVGNQANGGQLYTSLAPVNTALFDIDDILIQYFLKPFKQPEFWRFTSSNSTPEHNQIYHYVQHIFNNPDQLHEESILIAKHLFESTQHPNIKDGDVYVCYFKQLHLEDIIFNQSPETGYKVAIVDKSGRGGQEASFWKDDFLRVTPFHDAYHRTSHVMQVAQAYVTKQLGEEFEVTKADQIDLLNRSVTYFKQNETFDMGNFAQTVFEDNQVVASFQKFTDRFQDETDITIENHFDINAQAVKKQSRIFKSVIKLDKNFHIYVHGNRNLIERGEDEQGRKFYKLYFNDEE
ncbi:MAG: nucleoid-associated protein [Bacteroidia bacterium]|nr:nucleoid-associated protein [Bacteroidia bacterium]